MSLCNFFFFGTRLRDEPHIFCHTDDWQVLSKCCQNHRKIKPTIHQDIVCLYSGTDCTLYHCLEMVCRYCHGFNTPFIATASFIHLLVDSLQPFLLIGGGGAENKIQWQKTIPSDQPRMSSLNPFRLRPMFCPM
jgi:hypothetical protein